MKTRYYSYSRCCFTINFYGEMIPLKVRVTDPYNRNIGTNEFYNELDCILWAHKCIDEYYSKLYQKKRATVD